MIAMDAREQSTLADHAPWATLSQVIRGSRSGSCRSTSRRIANAFATLHDIAGGITGCRVTPVTAFCRRGAVTDLRRVRLRLGWLDAIDPQNKYFGLELESPGSVAAGAEPRPRTMVRKHRVIAIISSR